MKQLATAYSYNPSAKTVTLTGLNVPLGYILLVVNASRGQIIYNLADPLLASSSYQRGPDSVLTLNSSVDTSLHAASDSLTIFYDNGAESQMVLVQGPIGPQGPPGTTSWNGLLDKPAEFPPESHAHPITEITGLSSALAGKSSTQALAAEASTREAADLALGQRIDQALANLDPAAIDSIAEAVTTINTERTERIAADTALDTKITAETTARTTALSTKADLVSGKVPATQLPPLSFQTTRYDGDGTAFTFAPPGTLTNSDSPSAISVTINGVTQEPGSDYTLNIATNRVVLTSALPLGDKIVITRPILLPSNSTLTAEQLGALTATSVIDGGSF